MFGLLRIGRVAPSTKAAATLPLAAGGVVVEKRLRLREAAHWASWADTISMIRARHPEIVEVILRAVEAPDEVPSVQAVNRSVDSLAHVGFVPPLGRVGARGCSPSNC